jgi:DNA polymerase-3 subunit epsilon
MKLVFDVETTGLPYRRGFAQYFPPNQLEKYNKSRIVSIAWAKYTPDMKLIDKFYAVIKPTDFQIDDQSIATRINGITREMANKQGILITSIIPKLKEALIDVNTLIAHNFLFDINILQSELYRNQNIQLVEQLNSIDHICTMKESTPLLKIPFAGNNSFKSPKLIELFKAFYPNKEFEQHNALADVLACAKCYKGIIKIKSSLTPSEVKASLTPSEVEGVNYT